MTPDLRLAGRKGGGRGVQVGGRRQGRNNGKLL